MARVTLLSAAVSTVSSSKALELRRHHNSRVRSLFANEYRVLLYFSVLEKDRFLEINKKKDMGKRKKSVASARAPVCTVEKLGKLVHAVTSNGYPKQVAVKEIRRLSGAKVFPVHLAQLLLDPSCRVEDKILASEMLNEVIKTHWSSTKPGFLPPEIHSNEKDKIKSLLPTGLLESQEEVREVVADTVRFIAVCDWPANWRDLTETLLRYLNRENQFGCHGALVVLDRIDFKQAFVNFSNEFVPIFRELNRMLAQEDQYSLKIRCLAHDVFHSIIVAMTEDKETDMTHIIRRYLQPAVSQFGAAAASVWTSKNGSMSIKLKILYTFGRLLTTVPRCVFYSVPNISPLIWETLINSANEYRANSLNKVGPQEDVSQSVAGDEDKTYKDFLVWALKFVEALFTENRPQTAEMINFSLSRREWSYLQESFILPRVLHHFITLLEVTEDLIEKWKTNIEDFVKYEEGATAVVDGTRQTVKYLIMRFVDLEKQAVVDGLTRVVVKNLEAENTMRVNGQPKVSQNSWRSREAILLALGVLVDSIISKKNGESPPYDIVSLLTNIVLADLNNPESHPLLVARCLCIGGLYAKLMPQEMATAFLKATVHSLEGNRPVCVKICAAKAVQFWYDRDDSTVKVDIGRGRILRPHVPALFEGLFSLAENHKSTKVYMLVLESVSTLMLCRPAFTALIVNRIYLLAETAMHEFSTAQSHRQSCVELFSALFRNANCLKPVQERLVPTLVKMMSDKSGRESENALIALEIVKTLVENSPHQLSKPTIKTLFPACCDFVISTANAKVLSSGIRVIAAYLDKSFQPGIWHARGVKYGAEYIFPVLTHVLNQKFSVQGAELACKLLIRLIEDDFHKTLGKFDELSKALLNGIRIEKLPEISRCFLLVFAHILNKEFGTVFEFLASAPSPAGQQSPLELVLSTGFCRQYYFYDDREREKIKYVFGKIFKHSLQDLSSPLHQMTFKEDSGQTILLLVKICRLAMNNQAPV